MARIGNDEAEKYVPSNNGEWFALKNDGDVARVQFMFADCSELDVFTAHKIKLGDKERYVNCPREYGEPLDVCPLCDNEHQLKVVRFVVMYCHDDGKVKIWERGKQFIQRLEGLANRYYPLSNTVFEIERHGKAGDKQTTYEIFPCPNVQPVDLSDIEKPELLGGIVLDKSYDEMVHFIEFGTFPDAENVSANSTAVNRRRAVVDNSQPEEPSRRAVNNESTSRRSRRG